MSRTVPSRTVLSDEVSTGSGSDWVTVPGDLPTRGLKPGRYRSLGTDVMADKLTLGPEPSNGESRGDALSSVPYFVIVLNPA